MVQDSPSRKLEQFIVRFPDGMRDQLKAAAEANMRSMNAEIVGRLALTLDKAAGDYNAIGMLALVQRLEAATFASETLAQSLYRKLRLQGGALDEERDPLKFAIDKYADAQGVNSARAVELILSDWLTEQGYLLAPEKPSSRPAMTQALSEEPSQGPVDAPMVRAGRKMKAAHEAKHGKASARKPKA